MWLFALLSGVSASIKREEVSALAPGGDPSTCTALEGTGVTEKWCSNNCANVPPNCPASLCTCEDAAPAPEEELKAALASPSPDPIAEAVPIGSESASSPQNGKDLLHPDAVSDDDVKKPNGASANKNNASTAHAASASLTNAKQKAATAPKGAASKGTGAAAAKGNAAAKGTAAKADEAKKAGATNKAAIKPGSAKQAGCKTNPCQAHCPFNEKCAKQMKKDPKGEEKKAAPAKPDEKKPEKVSSERSKVPSAPAKPAEKKPEPKKQEDNKGPR